MVNTPDNRTDLLRKIKDEILNGTHLPLYHERVKNKVFPVIGEGNHSAKIMFIGEAPGKNEAATGKPFCGASGKVLDQLLESVGIPRQDVYVTNIVKDRPPMNRDPLPEEINAYAPYLDRQLEIIRPEIIATLGRFSMDYIIRRLGLESQLEPISSIHGKIFKAETSYGPDSKAIEDLRFANRVLRKANRDSVKIIPLYHPAVAVYNSNMKESLMKDFLILKQLNNIDEHGATS